MSGRVRVILWSEWAKAVKAPRGRKTRERLSQSPELRDPQMPPTPVTSCAEANPRRRRAGLAGQSGEGRPDLDGDFGPLLLLIGRRGSWQQQKDDRAHDQGSGEENLHVPLRDAQHPLGKASGAGEAEGREKVEARRLGHQRRHQRGRGEGRPGLLQAS